MRNHFIFLTAVPLVLGAFAASCGEDTEGLSKPQFREQASTIMCQADQEIGVAIGSAFGAGEPTPELMQEALDTIVTVSRRQLDEIEALASPSDLKEDVDAMIAEGRSATDVAEAQGLGFFEGDDNPWAETEKMATSLELDTCASE